MCSFYRHTIFGECISDADGLLTMPSGVQQTGIADTQVCLLPPGSRTEEQFQADLRELKKLPELRERLALERKFFCDSEHPLFKKAKQLGFRDAELMHPYLIKGKELPRDLEDWGKRMLKYVDLIVKVMALEILKKDLEAQARRRARKFSTHSGLWSRLGVVGKITWGSFFS